MAEKPLVKYVEKEEVKIISYFRSISVIPSISELTAPDQVVLLTPNKITGLYKSDEEYLETQFRLLREDFVAPLRRAIHSTDSASPTEHNCATKYKNVNVQLFEGGYRGTLVFDSDSEPAFADIFTEPSKRFMVGSFVWLKSQGANKKILTIGTVIYKNTSRKGIDIKFVYPLTKSSFYTVFDYKVLFEPYHKVLQILQKFRQVPLERYIIRMEKDISKSSPAKNRRHYPYSRRLSFVKGCDYDEYNLEYNRISLSSDSDDDESYDYQLYRNLPINNDGMLNESQKSAHDAAISREFTLIQGPPGTGKTHTLIEIVRSLMKQCPTKRVHQILILSYTNHALDNLLEQILMYTKSIIRVGNQSQSAALAHHNLLTLAGTYSRIHSSKHNYVRCDLNHLMMDHLIVGMTTSKAASMECSLNTLSKLQSPIVIIEEAAEILEAHVVACLTQHCRQLILIGDHKQLQPKTSDHRIETEYGLGISLFERMIKNNVPYYTLNVQHRMRPEISALLVPTIYETLEDHESVKNRPAIKGITRPLLFLNHYHVEENVDKCETKQTASKKNKFEAEYLVRLANYFRQNGCGCGDVVILSAYLAQCEEMQKLSGKFPLLGGVRIDTVDNFQGEEANIVLLSLVRNNPENSIGFLGKENRVCVALSRARNGLYIMGNIFQLSNKSEIWSKIQEKLSDQRALVPYLTLKCENHKTCTKIEDLQDFDKVSHGGCSLDCNNAMKCGNKCILKCHLTEVMEHKCGHLKCDQKTK